MKSKLTKHLLLMVIVAVALSVIFAVSSLAEITGDFGKITGIEEGKSYEAASVTINTKGTDKAIDETNKFDLTDTTNKDLAGLYVVREKGTTEWSDLIYVYGKYDERKDIHERTKNNKIDLYTGNPAANYYTKDFVLGKFSHNSWIGSASGNYGNVRFWTDTIFPNKFIKGIYAAGNDLDKKQAVIDQFDQTLKGYQFTYGFLPKEIISINEVKSYKYGIIGGNVGAAADSPFNLCVADNTMRFDAYVMGLDGEITIYTFLDKGKSYNSANGVETSTVDFTTAEGWNKPLPEEGYLVGFKVYPFYNVKAGNVTFTFTGSGTVINSNTRTRIQFGFEDYIIKQDSPKPLLSSFPYIEGGYGEVSGLSPYYLYECQFSTDGGTSWSDWTDVDAGVTAFKVKEGGIYRVRVKNTDDYRQSEFATITVDTYRVEGESLKSEIAKMHLPNDFVELVGDYEMDLTVKNWVSTLALENIKALAPESVITFAGEDYKFIVTASNIKTDDKVHYYNMEVSLDGKSRHNTLHNTLVDMAGEEYVTDVYFESSNGLPFEEAQVMVAVDNSFDGSDIEVRSYNKRINRLRKVEETMVYDGWAILNNFSDTYVLIVK